MIKLSSEQVIRFHRGDMYLKTQKYFVCFARVQSHKMFMFANQLVILTTKPKVVLFNFDPGQIFVL